MPNPSVALPAFVIVAWRNVTWNDTIWYDMIWHDMQEGTGSIRFVSVPDSFWKFIGSVRFGSMNSFFRVQRSSACAFRTRRGSVRFGSVRFRVRFRPVPELNGLVRPVRFGFLFLPGYICIIIYTLYVYIYIYIYTHTYIYCEAGIRADALSDHEPDNAS